jgi:hypothetical protein
MTEDVPVYAAALLLDPSKRLAYIQQNWPRDWHEAAIAGARDIWMTEYQGLAISKEPERRPAPLPSKKDGQLSFLFRSIESRRLFLQIQTIWIPLSMLYLLKSNIHLLSGGLVLSNRHSIHGSVGWPSISFPSHLNQLSQREHSQVLDVLLRGTGFESLARILRRWNVSATGYEKD